jgi:ubiquinone/menaquinone biosynthesis C-methylase UbiE
MLDVAVKRDPGKSIHWIQGSALNLPLKKDVFDVLLLAEVIHLFSDEERRNIFASLGGMLSKGGRIIMVTHSREQMAKDILGESFGELLDIDKLLPDVAVYEEELSPMGFKCEQLPLEFEMKMQKNEIVDLVKTRPVTALKTLSEENLEQGLELLGEILEARFPDGVARFKARYLIIKATKTRN